MELEVRGILSGESKPITLGLDASLSDLRKHVSDAFKLDGHVLPILALESSPDVALTDLGNVLVTDLGITSGSVLVMIASAPVWLWTDDVGESLLTRQLVYSEFDHPLYTLLRFDKEVEPGEEVLEPRHGILRVVHGDFPCTPEEVLNFLRGSNGAHRPVVPGLIVGCEFTHDKEKDMESLSKSPWRDFEVLNQVTAEHLYDIANCSGTQTSRTWPVADSALPVLIGAHPETSYAEVMAMVRKCHFYTNGELKEERAYFVDNPQSLSPSPVGFDPYLVVCANPEKRTISFGYTAKYYLY